MPPSAPLAQPLTPKASRHTYPSAMKHHHSSSTPTAGPSYSHLTSSPYRPNPSMVSASLVGPEAVGLDASSPEHFFVTLAAYADALDALPLDLTRSFSDLRELDAVLGSHLNSLTSRLNHLSALIEDPDVDPGQRLLALKEVAEEARSYKMGGEDKIRVALNTAETIISHTDYIDALVGQLDQFPEISPFLNPTKHLNLEQYYNYNPLRDRDQAATSSSSANANGATGLAANSASALSGATDTNGSSSAALANPKKKKVAATNVSSAKGTKTNDNLSVVASAASTGHTPNKKRKTVGSGAGVSASNHSNSKMAAARNLANPGFRVDDDDWPRSAATVAKVGNSSLSNKKKTDAKASSNNAGNNRLPRAAHAISVVGVYAEAEEDEQGSSGGRRVENGKRIDDASRVDEHAAATTSRGRTSRPVRGTSATATTAGHQSDDEDQEAEDGDGDGDVDDDQVEQPREAKRGGGSRANRGGSSRNARSNQNVGSAASPHLGTGSASTSASRADSPVSNGAGANNDDVDETRYCFCNNVSYGDMIGCDDDDCEREWFHLGCVGLTKPPQGTWYCDACLERRAVPGRSKAKKGKGGKAYETSTSKSKVSARR